MLFSKFNLEFLAIALLKIVVRSILTMAAFFITLCYHTIYARPWIYPALAFYGLDLTLRLVRFRVKDATLEAPDSQMTLVSSPFTKAENKLLWSHIVDYRP